MATTEIIPKAKAAAMKALELDDHLAEAHSALAYAAYNDWDWPSAEREFRRAIELNPNSAVCHQRYSEGLITRARFAESMAEIERSKELDPLSPQILGQLAYGYVVTHRYDQAIAEYQKIVELYPNMAWFHTSLAWVYALKHMYPQALGEYGKIANQDKIVVAENQAVASTLAWLYAVSGRRADALKIAKDLEDLRSHSYIDSYQLATIYAGLGQSDKVFHWLENGYEEHTPNLLYLGVDPYWYGMHSDPRYADLLRRVGFAAVSTSTT